MDCRIRNEYRRFWREARSLFFQMACESETEHPQDENDLW